MDPMKRRLESVTAMIKLERLESVTVQDQKVGL